MINFTSNKQLLNEPSIQRTNGAQIKGLFTSKMESFTAMKKRFTVMEKRYPA